MIRNIKVLGLALVAMLAMGAMAAQVASAASDKHEFWSTPNGASTSILTGAQVGQHVFTVGGVEVKCATAKFRGTVNGATVDHVEVYPEYKTCMLGSIEVEVDTTGCTYTFDSDTTLNNGVKDAPVTITCTPGGDITLSGGCTVHVAPQGPLHGVTYKTIPEHGSHKKDAVEVKATVGGITATSTGGIGCGFIGLGFGHTTHNGATYTGNTVVTGYEDLGGTPHKHEYIEGTQVDAAIDLETAN